MKIDFKNGGWIEGDIIESKTCDCPTCTCSPSHLASYTVFHKNGKVRLSGICGIDIDESTSFFERYNKLRDFLGVFGVKIYDK